ncbi:hypothetical protein N8080_02760 [Alphaproteobacteria bacterium]|nr:hypothetical protein [Alphaproteobacteria bacterium]
MNCFKLIFVIFILFAFSTKANEEDNDLKLIEIHKDKILDLLVLDIENNENEVDDESISIDIEDVNNTVEESNIIADDSNLDSIDDQNNNTESSAEQVAYIENESFFDIDNSLISIHLKSLKKIKSKTLHREFVNILSNINLDDENMYNDKVYFVIKQLYEMGEIEKAYKLVSKINLENNNTDKQNLEFFYLIKLNYLFSTYKLEEVCKLRIILLDQSVNLPENLLQKSDIFCLSLENNFSEAKLINSLLIESETVEDENFQKLLNFMLLSDSSNSFIPLSNIKSKDLIFLYYAMLRINELPLNKDFIEIDPLNLSIPVILSESTSMGIRINAAHRAYDDDLISINSLAALYQSVDFSSKEFENPDKTISNIDNNELIMAYYYQLANIQIFPDERLDVILKFFDFAKKSDLENIAYAITEKIIETFTPTAENSQIGIEIAFANIANNNFDDALKWLTLYEINNLKDKKIDYAKFLINLNQNDSLNTVINYLSDSNLNFDQINIQSSQESFQVLIDFLKIENISNSNFQYKNILDNRVMPSYFLMNDIKKQINMGNDLSVFILSLISLQSKNWIELHPEHLNLILEAINLYDNGSLKKQIIIEILSELKIF